MIECPRAGEGRGRSKLIIILSGISIPSLLDMTRVSELLSRFPRLRQIPSGMEMD